MSELDVTKSPGFNIFNYRTVLTQTNYTLTITFDRPNLKVEYLIPKDYLKKVVCKTKDVLYIGLIVKEATY